MDRNPNAASEKKQIQKGIFSEDRLIWLDLPKIQFILYDGLSSEDYREIDGGASMTLYIRQLFKPRSMIIDLSSLTMDELNALQDMLNRAVERVKPRVKELDAYAEERFQDGTATYDRLYRTIPKVYERQRKSS
jgi:hypothetical protein